MSAWNGVYEVDPNDPHALCDQCAEEHPERLLEDGLCPACVDEADALACPACRGSGRQITEDNFRPCPRCGGDGAWQPLHPSHPKDHHHAD